MLSDSHKSKFNQADDGSYRAWISGYPENRESSIMNPGSLTLSYNDSKDMQNATFASGVRDAEGNATLSMDVINSYLDKADNFIRNQGQIDYSILPDKNNEGNSNSLIGNILRELGLVNGQLPNAPGYDHNFNRGVFNNGLEN